MGNKQSDQGECQAFGVIKGIPGVGQLYGGIRAAVYVGKGDNKRAISSITGSFVAPFSPGAVDHIDRSLYEDDAGAWKHPTELLNSYRRPNLGDLIEFDRETHSHYGLYLGDGKVMHVYTGGQDKTSALIEEKTILDRDGRKGVCTWLKTWKVRVRRMHDQVAEDHFGASPKSKESIIAAAKGMEGKRVPYQYDLRNCEYYATLWRYGYGFSIQVARPTSTLYGGLMPGFGGILSTPLGIAEVSIYAYYREISTNEKY